MTQEHKAEWKSMAQQLSTLDEEVAQYGNADSAQQIAQHAPLTAASHTDETSVGGLTKDVLQSHDQLIESMAQTNELRTRLLQQKCDLEQHKGLIAAQASRIEALEENFKHLVSSCKGYQPDRPQQADLDSYNTAQSLEAAATPHDPNASLIKQQKQIDGLAQQQCVAENLVSTHTTSLQALDASMELLGEKMTQIEQLHGSLDELRSNIETEGDLRRQGLEGLQNIVIQWGQKIDKNIGLVEPVKKQYAQVAVDIADLQRANVESRLAEIKHTAELATYEVKKIGVLEQKLDNVLKKVANVEEQDALHAASTKSLQTRAEVVERKQDSVSLSLTTHERKLSAIANGLDTLQQQIATSTNQQAPDTAVNGNGHSGVVMAGNNAQDGSFNVAIKELNLIKDRLHAWEGLNHQDRLLAVEHGLAQLQSASDQVRQQIKEKDANVNRHFESIERQLQTIEDVTTTRSSAVEARFAGVERQLVAGVVNTGQGQGLKGTVGIMMEGIATRLDNVDHELAKMSVDHTRPTAHAGCNTGQLHEQYDADMRWLRQQIHALNNRLELEILDRTEANAKSNTQTIRVSLEAVLQFEKLWEFLGNSQFGGPKKEDAILQWQDQRTLLRWWGKQMAASHTKEDLEPLIDALGKMKRGEAVPEPYKHPLNSALPLARTRAAIDHRADLQPSSSPGHDVRETSNTPSSQVHTAKIGVDATPGQKKRKANVTVKGELNSEADSGPRQKKNKRGDSAAASASSFHPSASPK